MARIPSYDDRVSFMAARLENITNSSATEYMHKLDIYLSGLSLSEQFGAMPFHPDTSEGISLVVIIPVLYFLVVFLILGLLVAYVWYTLSSIPKEAENSGMASISRTSSRRNKTFTAGTSLHEFFHDAEVSRETIGSISKASVFSCATCKSRTVYKNETECVCTIKPCLKKLGHDYQCSGNPAHNTDTRQHQEQNGLHTPRRNNITLSSQSCSTDSFEEDALCRDNLRASMESHKLLRMGNSKIRPDDTYSWSDNTAYSTGVNGTKSSESRNIRSLRGFQNPVFTAEPSYTKTDNYHAEFEDPLGFAADQFQIQRQNSLETSVINISSVSAQTNYPSSSILVPRNSEISFFGQAGHVVETGVTPRAPVPDVLCDVNTRATKVDGSLPPLPPNHYHRRDIFSSPIVKANNMRQTTDNNSSSLLDTGPSDFDRSSVADSSADSGTLSLPSSIARFHASKTQPAVTPKVNGFLASTQNPTPDQNNEWSLARYLKSDNGHPEDKLSICPNVGSFNQSFDESIPVASFLDASFEIRLGGRTGIAVEESKEEFPSSGSVTPTKQTADERPEKAEPPVIYREGDAKMKRLLSLDQLKSGKVSVEQRLRQFGYVKSNWCNNIYTEANGQQEKSVNTETSWNSLASSSEGRIENLTQEIKKKVEVGEILSQSEKKMERRPRIGQILDAKNMPSNSPVKINIGNVVKWQERR